MDVDGKRVCDRDGVWYPIDRLESANGCLYYARYVTPPMDSSLFGYFERWLLPEPGWSIMLPHWSPGVTPLMDWYIEMEIIAVEGSLWTVLDGYLDMEVWEGRRARLDDADELAEGLETGAITLQEAAQLLRSLDLLCDALHQNGNSGLALLERYAPNLPH